jgi:hypothetical protein
MKIQSISSFLGLENLPTVLSEHFWPKMEIHESDSNIALYCNKGANEKEKNLQIHFLAMA